MEQNVLYRGFTINVLQDKEYWRSPNDEDNEDMFLVYDHRDFCIQRKGYDPTEIYNHITGTKFKTYNGYWIIPVYAHIHSGVTLSLGRSGYPFNCPWDTSMKGFALVKRQKKWSWKYEQARKIAGHLINQWNDYLSGNVYGYTIDELNDSCSGFYGDPEKSGLLEEAKSSIDQEIKRIIKKRTVYLKNIISLKVPLIYRKPLTLAIS